MSSALEENIVLQQEEIEALSVIYGNDYKIEAEDNKLFKITITDSSNARFVVLQITLPPEYPLIGPPVYTISAPWLSRSQKQQLCGELENIYCDHCGESVIFMWTEKIREYIENVSQEPLEIILPEEQDSIDTSSDISLATVLSNSSSNNEASGEDEISIQHGQPITDRRSTFQAHIAPVVAVEQVKEVMKKLLQNKKIASATHNISAYRIYLEPKKSFLQDCDDDGEAHAGSRLLHLLQILNSKNVLVVVSRWYGGIQLGPDRFKHINNVARCLLKESGFITEQKEASDNPPTSKSKKKKRK